MKTPACLSLTLILAVTAALAASLAETPQPDREAQKKKWERQFNKLDANGDKSLSKDEFLAGPFARKHAEKAAKRFSRWDKDGDAKLTLEEWTNRPLGKRKAGKATSA